MRGHACGDLRGAATTGGDDPVDTFRAGEPLDRELVLDRDDRAPVGVAETWGRRVAVGHDEGQTPAPGIRKDAQLRGACPENEEARHTAILAMGAARPAKNGAPTENACGGSAWRRPKGRERPTS